MLVLDGGNPTQTRSYKRDSYFHLRAAIRLARALMGRALCRRFASISRGMHTLQLDLKV